MTGAINSQLTSPLVPLHIRMGEEPQQNKTSPARVNITFSLAVQKSPYLYEKIMFIKKTNELRNSNYVPLKKQCRGQEAESTS